MTKLIRHDDYFEDEYGNKSSIKYFGSEEKAKEALESLIDCKNCINCKGCIDCTGCFECLLSTYCVDCIKCVKCADCLTCHSCYSCNDLEECMDCSHIKNGKNIVFQKGFNIHEVLKSLKIPIITLVISIFLFTGLYIL